MAQLLQQVGAEGTVDVFNVALQQSQACGLMTPTLVRGGQGLGCGVGEGWEGGEGAHFLPLLWAASGCTVRAAARWCCGPQCSHMYRAGTRGLLVGWGSLLTLRPPQEQHIHLFNCLNQALLDGLP